MIYDDEFVFFGKYSDMVEFLSMKNNSMNENGINIFKKIVDALLFSASIGVSKNCPVDELSRKSNDNTTKIFPKALQNNSSVIDYLYELAMITYNGEPGFPVTMETKLHRAFVIQQIQNSDPETIKQKKICDSIFKRYIYGGLEYIYNYFKDIDPKSITVGETITSRIVDFVCENLELSDDDRSKALERIMNY